MYLRSFFVATTLLAIVASPAFTEQAQPDHWAQYKYNTTLLIAKAVRYPKAACPDRLEGVAHVEFIVAGSGRILSRSIAKSSGHAILDQEALQAIDRVKAVPPLPPYMKGRQQSFTVPLRFAWGRFLGL